MLKTASLTLACVALLAVTTQAASISPIFDDFGELAEATFNPAGPSGIPNDAVAISTFDDGMGRIITLGLTATERFTEPPVGNDGAGTFSALAGGFSTDPTLARWNFGYFIKVEGGTFADFAFKLLYDFDPAAGTDESAHGVLDFNAAITSFMIPLSAVTLVQDSQNLGFGFLAAASSFIAPPAFGAFDPNAIGEYTFSLRAFDSTGTTLLEESAIQVNTVPEPISASLFGIGALGLAIGGARRRRRKQTA